MPKRLDKPSSPYLDDDWDVQLMQALNEIHQKAEANPEEAALNETTISDNHGGRIMSVIIEGDDEEE